MLFLVDNNDSFTYNLYDFFRQFRKRCVVKRGSQVRVKDDIKSHYEGIVFSPGPGRPDEHPVMHEILDYVKGGIPILGICLGYQAIGAFYGCRLQQLSAPIHGRTSTISHTGHPSYYGVPDHFDVMHYHSLYLDTINEEALEVTGYGRGNMPMSFVHKTDPVWGFQYHPESILTSNGYNLITNWLYHIEQWNSFK